MRSLTTSLKFGEFCFSVLVTAILCWFSFVFFDRWLADAVGELWRLSSVDLLAKFVTNCAVAAGVLGAAVVAVQRSRRIITPPWLGSLSVAGLTTIVATAVNSVILKPLFGRISTWNYLHHHGEYGFEFFRGTMERSGFPSGHTVMTVTFFAVLWHSIPSGRPFYVAASSLVCVMLIAGGWHFLSDVIAGIFVGILFATAAIAICKRLSRS